ncbi:DUF481 domain-containing protein [Caulobacter segnis]|uniref:DUF481 domain-containing protein n=1 Tax=Caulobacter segnis TaxID=88688 RepID=UPI0024102BD8|nr:DUF481 domain-containing protein [Caulobacter segnis]MDG2520286.1 DUF481 domain-containing protein [Caulobacter segnis]
MRKTGIILTTLLLGTAANAEPLPEALEKMIRAAAQSGDPRVLETTVGLARRTHPEQAADVDRLAAELVPQAPEPPPPPPVAAVVLPEPPAPKPSAVWKGEARAGGSLTTGNNDSVGATLGLSLARQSALWRHEFKASGDYSKENGLVSRERYLVSHQVNRRIGERAYALAVASWEQDRIGGFDRRFSEALGVGVSAIDRPDIDLDLEGGPGWRQTWFVDGSEEETLAWRAAVKAAWRPRDGVSLTNETTTYLQDENSTLASTTALTFKLIGGLSTQASVLVKHETSPPIPLEKTDTTTRMSVVYAF